MTAPGTVPTAQARSGLGVGLASRRGMVSQSSDIFNSPRIKTSLARNAPSHLRAREIPDLAARKTAVPYASPGAGAAEGTARLRRAPFFPAPRPVAFYDAQGALRAPRNSPAGPESKFSTPWK